MNELKNWTEVTKGLYRYVISSNVAYEIHVIYWDHTTDILAANASLFLVGEWYNTKSCRHTTERECLLDRGPVTACLAKAVEDDKENNK